MVGRSYSTRLIAGVLALGLGLAACSDAPTVEAPGITVAEEELRKQRKVMARTILEGAALGGAVGGGISIGLGGDGGDGFAVGLGAGAAAGTYVAAVRRKYIRRERRLDQIKSDLDRNAAEMQTALFVMNQVLEQQRGELAAIQARAAAGQASAQDVAGEVQQARENLDQMEALIDGAESRQEEFSQARGLTLRRRDTVSPIDPDLAALADRVEAMRQVANDLATAL